MTISGQLKFTEYITTLLALVAYYNFYYTTYDYVISGTGNDYKIDETKRILITGFYCYKFSTFAIVFFTNIATVFDVFELREKINKIFYYIECCFYTFSCFLSIFCGYLAIYTLILLDQYKIIIDSTLLIASVCSFVGAALFFCDFCRVFSKEIKQNELLN